jgi:hypothetical protein
MRDFARTTKKDGGIGAETALAEAVNRAGAVKDIRSARAALARALP